MHLTDGSIEARQPLYGAGHAISYVQSHPAGDRGNPKAVRAGIYRPDHNISCFRFCDG